MSDDAGQDDYGRAADLQKARRYQEAAEIYLRLAATAVTVNLATNLGRCMTALGRRAEAVHWLGLVARHRPDSARARRLLGDAYAAFGDAASAERELLAARAADPADGQVELSLANLYLSTGRYAEGWPLLAARMALHPDVVPKVDADFPEWRGEPLAGRSVLVWVEQGFGDQIQMSRFANVLKARGASRVSLACRPALAHLFSTLAGVDTVIPIGPNEVIRVARHDLWTRYFSLPEHLGITRETVPSAPYLSAPPDRLDRWRGARGVGLVWRASPTGFNAANKNLPEAAAQRLLDRGAMSLLPEDTGARDFADTAAIVQGLDLVISIDTAGAHLAGAMGKPCWTLVPFVDTDWRWLPESEHSPWYPTMRLYRQTRAGHWDDVVDRLLADWTA